MRTTLTLCALLLLAAVADAQPLPPPITNPMPAGQAGPMAPMPGDPKTPSTTAPGASATPGTPAMPAGPIAMPNAVLQPPMPGMAPIVTQPPGEKPGAMVPMGFAVLATAGVLAIVCFPINKNDDGE